MTRGARETAGVVAHVPFLNRTGRVGDWDELSEGTFSLAQGRLAAGDTEAVAQLLEVAVQEAEELHDIYGRWPAELQSWLVRTGEVEHDDLAARVRALDELVGADEDAFESGWQDYTSQTRRLAQDLRGTTTVTADQVEALRAGWQDVHDRAVDRLYGLLDIGVRLVGEHRLGEMWDHLMSDWYDEHASRIGGQPWSESRQQLGYAILDGFHAHLTGDRRHGDVELVDEPGRTGFRFRPCGSGGRAMQDSTTEGSPRPGPPYGFAVTTERHDWAWNTEGICAYCVHCCLLNEVAPIDRIGHPTRVIEPPVWPADREAATCTWWIYDDPADIPDWVYERVGRTRRGASGAEGS
ncbi:hypothetical protein [Nocardioides bigeumensis]|uniref:Uncharacterized protein n=1 Tax=Nocardioides bigeumensis TaxID=433657 RepID=A0ABN2YBQ6_9ACTN